ncbi:hypothetical protein VKT23_017239 [Stygiomarasmius scandens]|uniref:Glycoside hydrolase family 76 protein n=1 Tax=Marasmiellus scandens TaxID=2682957 RepID=A0ABR1IVR7_9AGAR
MDEATLNGLGTGSFLILSAALAEATNDQTYAAAAEKSIDFFRTHLYNADNIVQDSISARQNDSCSTNILILPSNAGLFIEGLAILVSQDVSRQQLLEDTISAAIPNQAWQGPDGVINTTIGNLELVRALATVYNRNSTSSDMRSYIRGYLAVQYNAVIELATEEGSNIYTSLWLGPPSSQFLADNQTAALAALIAAISLTNDTATPSGDPIPAPSSSSPARSTSTPVGTIVGSVIGGISFVLITGIAWSLLRRRKRRQNSQRSYRVSLESDNPLYAGQTGSHQIHVNSLRTPASVPQTDVTTNQASISPLQPQRLTEKRALRNNPQRQQWSPRLDSDTWTPGTGNPSSNWSGSNTRSSRRDMTTAELVRMLNERLQPGQWREDEMPPEYPESSRSR